MPTPTAAEIAAFEVVRRDIEQRSAAEVAAIRADRERIERRIGDEALTTAIAQAGISGEKADQLRQLWRDQVVVETQGDDLKVRTRGFLPIADFVQHELKKPEYNHFKAPAQPAAPVNRPGMPTTAEPPTSLGAAIIADAIARRAEREAAAPTDARLDPSRPFGLGRSSAGAPALGPLGIRFR